MSKQHKDLDNANLHDPKDFDTAPNETALIKNNSAELEYRSLSELGATGPSGPAGTTLVSVEVASLNDPTEIKSEIGTVQGDIILVFEAVAGDANPFAIYTWDVDARAIDNPPFQLQSTGGSWIQTTNGFFQSECGLDEVSPSKFHGNFYHIHNSGKAYYLHGGTKIQLLTRDGYNRTELTGTELNFFAHTEDVYKFKTLSSNTTLNFINYQMNDVRHLEIASTASETLTFPAFANVVGVYDTSGAINYITIRITDEGTGSTGTITVVNNSFDTGDTVIVNGVSFVKDTDWVVGATTDETTFNICRAISSSSNSLLNGKVHTHSSGSVITVHGEIGGVAGDSITLAVTDNATTNFTLSGATLTGGVDGEALIDIKQLDNIPYTTSQEASYSDMLSTGFEGAPPLLSINGDNTKFDMSECTIVHVDNSTVPATVTKTFTAASTNNTPTFLLTDTSTFISIDTNGAIIQRTAKLTPEQRRDEATVGFLSHPGMTVITDYINNPQTTRNAASQAHDLMEAIGFFSTSGNQISGITSTLSMRKATGSGFALNTNASVTEKDPHNFNMPALDPAVMFQILRDATPVTISEFIDPTQWDNAGVLDTVPANNNATINYIYIFPNDQIAYVLGQQIFTTFSDAKDAAGTESVVLPSDISDSGLLLARVIVRKTTTDLTDSSEAFILPSSAVSGGGSSLTSLQQSYEISAEPEIEINSTNGALTVSDSATPLGVSIFEVKRSGGASTILDVKTEGAVIDGVLDILHTATSTDDHCLELDVNAAGFGDVKGIDIDYITGAIQVGSEEAVILANIDESISVGGSIAGLEILATDEGGASVNALVAGISVNPLQHLSGTFAVLDSGLVNATDRLAEFSSSGSNVQMFVADNDTITLGSASKFEEIEIILAIAASQNIQPTFEFSTGVGTWNSFTPTDGTNGFLNTGIVLWFDDDIPSWAVGTGSEYLIRITRTRNGLSTPPTESLIKVGSATQYCWDKDANLKIKSAEVNGQAYAVTNTLVDAANISTDMALSNVHTVTLTANRILDLPTNLKAGSTVLFIVKQDATGSRTLDTSAFLTSSGDPIVLSTTANAVDILSGVSDGSVVYLTIAGDFK